MCITAKKLLIADRIVLKLRPCRHPSVGQAQATMNCLFAIQPFDLSGCSLQISRVSSGNSKRLCFFQLQGNQKIHLVYFN
jgi:hypothetical protein